MNNTICLKEIKRLYGEHLTPKQIFEEFIFPEIENTLYDYIWVDLFAGEGNLIFPLLDKISPKYRVEFFKEHIRLYDIQEKMINYMINKAVNHYGIPLEIAKENIKKRDNLKDFPLELLGEKLPIYHITNPPYLYIGYIKKQKNEEYRKYLSYFDKDRSKLQDLYQIALYNDLKAGLEKMIYIIPTNFIYGKSGSNEIRKIFFPIYNIDKAYIIEEKIFENTGVNVGIFFFTKKEKTYNTSISFKVIKIGKSNPVTRYLTLRKKYNYIAGSEFEEFIETNKKNDIKISFYLMKNEILANRGNNKVVLLNANKYNKSINQYEKEIYYVNNKLYRKIKNNILWIRTVDTGSFDGRAGLYLIKDLGVDGIVTEKPYRTHPIPIFFNPELSINQQIYLKEEFNKKLEYLRELTDSEFMTTYKYSNSNYVRKYLGLIQVKKIISTIKI